MHYVYSVYMCMKYKVMCICICKYGLKFTIHHVGIAVIETHKSISQVVSTK